MPSQNVQVYLYIDYIANFREKVQGDRPSIPQTNDRKSPQTKQRSPIFSDTLNVQSYRPLIPQTNDRKSPQINQRSPISSDTLNVQSDRPLIPQTKDRNSSQIKQRSPIFIIMNQ